MKKQNKDTSQNFVIQYIKLPVSVYIQKEWGELGAKTTELETFLWCRSTFLKTGHLDRITNVNA